MAKVKVAIETVRKVVETKEAVYNVSMSLDEAIAVATVLGRIGGSPDTSRRRYTQSVFDAITDSLKSEGHNLDKKVFSPGDASGYMSFNDTKL